MALRSRYVIIGILSCLFAKFLMSQNVSATTLDLTNSNNVSLAGFCANNARYEAGALTYSPYNISGSDYSYTKSLTDTGYNQFQLTTAPCSDPMGITTIDLYWNTNEFGTLSDGQYINIDLVSNNYSFPFFNGATIYAYESGTGAIIPAFVDNRTYDVRLQKDSYTWLTARDQLDTVFNYRFDEVEVSTQSPAVLEHMQYSIKYDASEFGQNGLSNISIGTYVSVDGRLTDFGSTYYAPLFYLPDDNITGSTMFWLYISVTDTPEFEEVPDNDIDSATLEYYDNQYEAIDNIGGQSVGGIDVGNTQTAMNLIDYISSFFTFLGSVSVAQNCELVLPLPSLMGGSTTANLCQGKDSMGNTISVISSIALFAFFIPLAIGLLRMIYSEIRSFTNG